MSINRNRTKENKKGTYLSLVSWKTRTRGEPAPRWLSSCLSQTLSVKKYFKRPAPKARTFPATCCCASSLPKDFCPIEERTKKNVSFPSIQSIQFLHFFQPRQKRKEERKENTFVFFFILFIPQISTLHGWVLLLEERGPRCIWNGLSSLARIENDET